MKHWLFFFCVWLAGFEAVAQVPPVVLVAGTASNATGSFSIPVTAQNFQQILALQGSIQWDNTKIVLDSVSNITPILTGVQFNDSVIANTGSLSYVWIDNAMTGQSLASGNVLFRLYFTVAANASGTAAIQFASTPTNQLLVHANGSTINTAMYTNGWVQLATPTETPLVRIGNVNAGNQSLVQIPITASAMYNIIGFQGSILWDSTVFKFSNITNINAGLAGFQFNHTAGNGGNPPAVSFLWLQDNLQAQSFPANTVLFTLVLEVKSLYAQTSTVYFGNWPTVTQLIAADGSPINNVVITGGTVAVAGAYPPPEYTLGTKLFTSDTTVTIPLTVKNFRSVSALQGTISWDATKLRISNVVNVSSILSGISFDSTILNGEGRLSFIWADASLLPQSVSENATLFALRYRVVQNVIGHAPIRFTNSPTNLLTVSDVGTTIPNTSYTNGLVTFTNAICIGGSVSITSSILGNTYQWQIDSGQGYQNLTNAGVYSGTNTATMAISTVHERMGGYKLRCRVGAETSEEFPIQFTNFWIGGTSTAWQTASNWSCNVVPNRNTNVVISSANQNPVIQSNVTIRSLQVAAGITLRVATGFTLDLIGNQ